MQHPIHPCRLGIVGGLGMLGAADLFYKLAKAMPAARGQDQAELLFEQRPFRDDDRPGDSDATHGGRKLYVFDTIRRFEARGVDAVLLPCFISHTFLDELRVEVRLPILSIMDALQAHLAAHYPGTRRLGVLTSDHVRASALFERHFPATSLLYPRPDVQREGVMTAIYGADGIKAGQLQGVAVERLARACRDLLDQGAELILPGFSEVPLVMDALLARGIPVLDVNRIYAEHAVARPARPQPRPFKIGVVGGVGPAATVDFMDKIVRNTPAGRDQEHLKIVVEQNPQIPDRTANLLGHGADPTIALYATCKKLEAAEADVIAIPCNTAHAFVGRIQPQLAIPVVHMLVETVAHIRRAHPQRRRVGLLATSGTVASGVYHDIAAEAGLELIVPDEADQARVMEAIYGPQGVKAGHTSGRCVDDLMLALVALVLRGAEVVILGCTELPLLLAQDEDFPVAGRRIALLDPTEILAQKCVQLAAQAAGAAPVQGAVAL
ncbi:aspartate racemase [Azoarcus sp. DD4]|uniref:aspartate/glutamate racemase family protein n=1 Tax=Azoarcus sp. DD4 TaxID=2027405 RepID=UPI001128A120|nr:amino acid racemase [Azoarcus sp. DD4]QDF97852.1 aspartate racemase [Azoarcus sp. DD4]